MGKRGIGGVRPVISISHEFRDFQGSQTDQVSLGTSLLSLWEEFSHNENTYTQFATEEMVGKGEDHFLLGQFWPIFSGLLLLVSGRLVQSV